MAQSTLLALGLTAANSSTFTVGTGQVKTVGVFGSDGPPPSGYAMRLMMDTPEEGVAVCDANGPVILGPNRCQTAISGPGTYYVTRDRLESTTLTVGVFLEDGS